MNAESKNEYLWFFRGHGWTKGLTPEQIQQVMDKSREWFQSLVKQGKAKVGQSLEPAGKVVSAANGRMVVADGPFVESKEVIGGYFMLEAGTMEEAAEIAKDFPGLEYGASLEVRLIADICPVMRQLETTDELTSAMA